jgi:hypothetical protein
VIERGGGYTIILEKNINFMPHFPSWVIKTFQLPFDGVGVMDGNYNSSITIKGADQMFLVTHPCGN